MISSFRHASTLARMRWTFLVMIVMSIPPQVVTVLTTPAAEAFTPLLAVGGMLWLIGSSVLLKRRGVPHPLLDVADCCALALLAPVRGSSAMLLSVSFPIIFFTSTYGSGRRLALRTFAFLAVFVLVFALSADFDSRLLPGFVISIIALAGVTHLLTVSSERNARSLVYQRTLAEAGKHLVGAQTRQQAFDAAIVAAHGLLENDPAISAAFVLPAAGELLVAAARGSQAEVLRGRRFSLDYLHDGAASYRIRSELPGFSEVILAPLCVAGELAGAVALAAPSFIPTDTEEALRALAAETTLALETLSASERFRSLVQHAPDLIMVLDRAGTVTYGSPAITGSLGYPADDWIGRSVLELVHAEDRTVAAGALQRVIAAPSEPRMVEVRVQHATGTWVWLEWRLSNLLDDAAVQGLVLNCRDVTERRLAEAALRASEERHRHQALHDPLTGLANRALLADRVQQAILVNEREPQPFALLLLDLDRFKEVNDTLGHHAGDALLQQVADRLQRILRGADTAARLGGDEFALLVPAADATAAARIAARVQDVLQAPFRVEEQEVSVAASIGIALYPEHGQDLGGLLRRADIAMYRAKEDRAGHLVYSADLERGGSASRLGLDGALRRALAQDELTLVYQPKVDCQDGRLVGVEALIRWQHPELGMLPPDQFIPLAEQTGLIRPLTHWVLDTALRQQRGWRDEGLEVPIAINLSAHDVQDVELPARVAQSLARWQPPASSLTVELTEGTLVPNPEQALSNLTTLGAMGVRVAVDDFGTGYCSLAYLKQLPIHELKIDRSFVSELAEHPRDLAIVRSTIDLGHNLGLQVVAEGIEDSRTLQQLHILGCDVAQGYHLSRPLPPAALAAWCHATRRAPTPFQAAA